MQKEQKIKRAKNALAHQLWALHTYIKWRVVYIYKICAKLKVSTTKPIYGFGSNVKLKHLIKIVKIDIAYISFNFIEKLLIFIINYEKYRKTTVRYCAIFPGAKFGTVKLIR